MESAIPSHLQCPRKYPRKISDDCQPPYPGFVARYKPNVTSVVMAYFGVQYLENTPSSVVATKILEKIAHAFSSEASPGFWDRARYVDGKGYTNVITIAYWDDTTRFDAWFAMAKADQWTHGALTDNPDIGIFMEIFRPAFNRFETLFATEVTEGVAVIAENLSGPIQEHGYWGSARDRIPLSQTDALEPSGVARVITSGKHQRVLPHENLCLIRSGQDWTATEDKERKMYLEDIEPFLRQGMEFLRDEGKDIGCYTNRYMTLLESSGQATEKSFGMSFWKSLKCLEQWAESHPTHLKIFGAFINYMSILGPSAKFRAYHEVTVAAANEQVFEYWNCHAQTGMLAAV